MGKILSFTIWRNAQLFKINFITCELNWAEYPKIVLKKVALFQNVFN